MRANLWNPPDQILIEAGQSGELLIARIRLVLTLILLIIPLYNVWLMPTGFEKFVGTGTAIIAFLFSALMYAVISRGFLSHWFGFVTSLFDVALVSTSLASFLFFGTPHTAVNSKVVFETYFLAIGATSLRYDPRICVVAGLFAIGEYLLIIIYATSRWDLNDPVYAPFKYGIFDWSSQISRLVLLAVATFLSTIVVTQVRKLRLLSTNDRLTGLFNRGFFDDRLASEVSRSHRYARPLSLAILDVDRFKDYNDTNGHTAGDAALQRIAGILQSACRRSDLVARYGGEEFVIILPETDLKTAGEKVEIVRQHLEQEMSAKVEGVSLTISAGVSSFPDDGQTARELIECSDRRLFQAKKGGRNRVVIS